MKKLGYLLLVVGLVLAVGSYAKAEGISLSGEIEIDGVLVDNLWDYDGDASDSQAFVRVESTLGVTADLTGNVVGYLELENRQGNMGAPDGLIGETNSSPLEVEQAYIEAKEAFRRELSLKAGIFDLAYDLRGNGDAFMLDTSEGFAKDDAFGGWMARWNQKPWVVDAFMTTAANTGLPGADKAHSDMYGVVVDWENNEKNLVRFMLLYNLDRPGYITGGADSDFVSVGLGADWFFLKNALEVYGEFGFQSGTHIDAAADVDHSALAVYVGAQYTWSNVKFVPAVDLSFWYYSGADPNEVNDMDAWYNMGHLNQTVIVENGDFGYGTGNDYWTIRLEGTIKPTDKTKALLSFNYFQTTEDVLTANGDETDLGIEIDLCGSYAYTQNLSVGLNLGAFMPGDAATGGGAAEDDMVFLANLDTTLKF